MSGYWRHLRNEAGTVKYIVAGNAFHNLFLKEFKTAYPEAKVIGPDALIKMNKADFALDAARRAPTLFGYEDEIIGCYFSGYADKDIAFLHKPSKTVIAADLLNCPSTEQYSKSQESPHSILQAGLHPAGWTMRLFIWMNQENKTEMSRDAKTVASWDFERFIPCHGDVIEHGAKQAWRTAWKGYLS